MSACAISPDAGAVRAMLASVSCNTQGLAHRGFDALTGGQAFQVALTCVLAIYVALVGYRLLFGGGARLSDWPRMALMIGAVLALVSSWSLFETLVFDLTARAPSDIAELVTMGGAGRQGADPIGRLQVAYDQLGLSASAFEPKGSAPPGAAAPAGGASAGPQASSADTAGDSAKTDRQAKEKTAASALGVAAGAVLTADAGLVAVSDLVIGVLNAVGPVFIVLILFDQTRGLFEGWVRALVAAALASMSAWVAILLMLGVLDPWLVALAQQRELRAMEPNTGVTAAAIVYVFTAAQLALVAGGAVIAFGFRLPSPRIAPAPERQGVPAAETGTAALAAERLSRAGLLADQLRRFDPVLEHRSRAAATASAVQRPMRLVVSESASAPSAAFVAEGLRGELRRDAYRGRGVRG